MSSHKRASHVLSAVFLVLSAVLVFTGHVMEASDEACMRSMSSWCKIYIAIVSMFLKANSGGSTGLGCGNPPLGNLSERLRSEIHIPRTTNASSRDRVERHFAWYVDPKGRGLAPCTG